MKKIFFISSYTPKKKGSVLLSVLLMSIILVIFGTTVITASLSNFKLTNMERDYQSVYYIAEAGVNDALYKINEHVEHLSGEALTHNDFFYKLETYLYGQIDEITLSGFENQFGHQPSAFVTVGEGSTIMEEDTHTYSKRTTSYALSSTGGIGNLSRTVSLTIDVSHKVDKKKEGHPAFNYLLFSPNNPLTLPNQSQIDGSIYSKDINLSSAGTKISGNIISETYVRIEGNHSHPKIEGNVCALNGFVEVSSRGGLATVHGDVNASGYVTLGSAGTVEGSVFSGDYVTLKAANAKVIGNVNASGHVTLESGTSVKQDVFAGGNVSLLNSNSRVNGNVHAGGNIYKPNNTYIDGSSWAGGTINQSNPAFVNQLVPHRIEPKSPSFCIIQPIQTIPEIKSFDIGVGDVVLLPNWQNSQAQIISPGSYKNLTINGDNTVRFVSGDYYFDNINANSWGIKIQFDLSNGPINIYTKQNVNFGGGGTVEISENGSSFVEMEELIARDRELAIELAGKVYWESHNNFNIGNRNWFGSVLADNNFTAGSAPRLIGAYVVNRGRITLGNNPITIYAPPTDSSAGGGSAGSGAGQNTIPLEDRVKISIPIKEKY